jgi:hypothetical protein
MSISPIRHSLAAKRTLMDITAGDLSAFSEGTVAQVLEVAKEHLKAELTEELSREQQKLKFAESTIEILEKKEVDRLDATRQLAQNIGRICCNISRGIIFLILIGGSILTFPWSLPNFTVAWGRYVGSGLIMAFFIYTAANMMWGTTISSISETLESRLVPRIERWILALTERRID